MRESSLQLGGGLAILSLGLLVLSVAHLTPARARPRSTLALLVAVAADGGLCLCALVAAPWIVEYVGFAATLLTVGAVAIFLER
jgi:hypothetical protein